MDWDRVRTKVFFAAFLLYPATFLCQNEIAFGSGAGFTATQKFRSHLYQHEITNAHYYLINASYRSNSYFGTFGFQYASNNFNHSSGDSFGSSHSSGEVVLFKIYTEQCLSIMLIEQKLYVNLGGRFSKDIYAHASSDISACGRSEYNYSTNTYECVQDEEEFKDADFGEFRSWLKHVSYLEFDLAISLDYMINISDANKLGFNCGYYYGLTRDYNKRGVLSSKSSYAQKSMKYQLSINWIYKLN